MTPNHEDLHALIARYNRELMEQYASTTPTEIDQEVTEATQNAPLVPQVTIEEPKESPPSEEIDSQKENELIDTGRLQVRVSTENQAVPLPGAVITITRKIGKNDELIRTVIADDSGLTPLMDLPTKDRRLSLTPGHPNPYAVYTVDVTADGYFPKRFIDLPIYGGVTAIQNVSMIPLPESGGNDIVLSYPQGGPVGL